MPRWLVSWSRPSALACRSSRTTPCFGSIASVIIGLLIAVVALFLAREAKGLLIGEAADSALVLGLGRATTHPGVMGIGEI